MFDPFSGSGTTCARAKKLGRHYLGMEINEDFWKSSRRRIGDTTEISITLWKADNGEAES